MNKKLNPYVLIIQNNLITETFKCKNSQDVEKKFLEVCREKLSNFNEYKEEDFNFILEQGYEKFNKGSISICWL